MDRSGGGCRHDGRRIPEPPTPVGFLITCRSLVDGSDRYGYVLMWERCHIRSGLRHHTGTTTTDGRSVAAKHNSEAAEATSAVLGLDIGGTKLAAGVVGADGTVHS